VPDEEVRVPIGVATKTGCLVSPVDAAGTVDGWRAALTTSLSEVPKGRSPAIITAGNDVEAGAVAALLGAFSDAGRTMPRLGRSTLDGGPDGPEDCTGGPPELAAVRKASGHWLGSAIVKARAGQASPGAAAASEWKIDLKSGALDAKGVQDDFLRQLAPVLACGEGDRGRLQFSVEVGPDGAVRRVQIDKSDTTHPRTDSCVAKAISGMGFASSSDGKSAQLSGSLSLRPAAAEAQAATTAQASGSTGASAK
jgi:hypothetical protein